MDLFELKYLLPKFYDDVFEFQKLMEYETSLFEDLKEAIEKSQQNIYISTADSDTLSIYENLLKLSPRFNDNLTSRRTRILARMSNRRPYTLRYLRELIDAFGSEKTTISVNYNDYQLKVDTTLEKVSQMEELDYILRTVVPANMEFDVNNNLSGESRNNVYIGSSVTLTEIVEITHDITGTFSSTGFFGIGQGITNTMDQEITHDVNETQSSKGKTNPVSIYTITEVVESH